MVENHKNFLLTCGLGLHVGKDYLDTNGTVHQHCQGGLYAMQILFYWFTFKHLRERVQWCWLTCCPSSTAGVNLDHLGSPSSMCSLQPSHRTGVPHWSSHTRLRGFHVPRRKQRASKPSWENLTAPLNVTPNQKSSLLLMRSLKTTSDSHKRMQRCTNVLASALCPANNGRMDRTGRFKRYNLNYHAGTRNTPIKVGIRSQPEHLSWVW